jgi:hypothetical protein
MSESFAPLDVEGPSASELAAIEAEWPLIEAEMALLDAEIAMLTVQGGPSPLDWRRLRRAQARLCRAAAAVGRPLQLDRLAA